MVAACTWSFEPVQSLVREPRDRGVSLRARTPESESSLVSLRGPELVALRETPDHRLRRSFGHLRRSTRCSSVAHELCWRHSGGRRPDRRGCRSTPTTTARSVGTRRSRRAAGMVSPPSSWATAALASHPSDLAERRPSSTSWKALRTSLAPRFTRASRGAGKASTSTSTQSTRPTPSTSGPRCPTSPSVTT